MCRRQESWYCIERENNSEWEWNKLYWVPGLDLCCSYFTRGIKTQRASPNSPSLFSFLLQPLVDLLFTPVIYHFGVLMERPAGLETVTYQPRLELKLSSSCNLIWLLSHPPSEEAERMQSPVCCCFGLMFSCHLSENVLLRDPVAVSFTFTLLQHPNGHYRREI